MLTILLQDEHLVAIDKPAGMLVHRSRIDVHAREFAMQTLRDQIGQPVFPVHRIDRPTSGVLLFALDSHIARELSEQFQQRTISKTYYAIVRGHSPTTGTWDEPLIEKPDKIVDRLADKDKPAQSAITKFETLQSWTIPFSTGKYPNSRYSLVDVQPLTGRKHQIRRHFNHMAHPLIGDTTHGDRRHNRLFREKLDVHRLLLVARTLTFEHPVAKELITITAPLGIEFEKAIQRLDELSGQVESQP